MAEKNKRFFAAPVDGRRHAFEFFTGRFFGSVRGSFVGPACTGSVKLGASAVKDSGPWCGFGELGLGLAVMAHGVTLAVAGCDGKLGRYADWLRRELLIVSQKDTSIVSILNNPLAQLRQPKTASGQSMICTAYGSSRYHCPPPFRCANFLIRGTPHQERTA